MGSLVGKTLRQYRFERLLAKGNPAEVYQGRDERLERWVAMKVSTLPAAIEQFQAEARLSGSLDHPNILPVYDFGQQDGVAYLVMHYAAGGSLEDRLRAANGNNGLPLEEVAYYLDQAAAALDYTHTRGVLHCNLKPSNLLLRERWLMLGGFGKARRGTATGRAADMYALGVTLYRLLWGGVPRADSAGRLEQGAKPLPTLAGLAPRVALEIEALLRRAMAPRPEERPHTAGALAAEFRAVIAAPGEKGGAAPGAPAEIPLICPTCGFLNKPQARFCRNDGTKLPMVCPRCGAENRSDAKFCQRDGAQLR
ncbi:MAG TPA: serine/threonine-protein kinase [Ktedonobacterales bacterium]